MTRLAALILFGLSMFTIGGYTEAVIHATREIETYRWVITSFFTVFWFIYVMVSEKEK